MKMIFIKRFERLKKAHELIFCENTGTPEEFAKKLNISRSQLYNLLEELKEFKAPLKYSKKSRNFFYSAHFDLELEYSLKIISEDNSKLIFGGICFRPILLDGTLLSLL